MSKQLDIYNRESSHSASNKHCQALEHQIFGWWDMFFSMVFILDYYLTNLQHPEDVSHNQT